MKPTGDSSEKSLWVSSVEEIVRLHQGILSQARMSIENAIRIGEILSRIKNALRHGEWLPWLEEFVPFDQKTAWNYMRCFEHRSKLGNVPNLIGAYAVVLSHNVKGERGPPQLHKPNFFSQAFRLRQSLIGLFNHHLQRRPLKRWETEEISDLASSLKPLIELLAQLESELARRNDQPSQSHS